MFDDIGTMRFGNEMALGAIAVRFPVGAQQPESDRIDDVIVAAAPLHRR
jgi:hypothetical protein